VIRAPRTRSFVARNAARVPSQAHPLELPLARDEERGWKPHNLFRGTTAVVPGIRCHVSVLEPGAQPHPPHRHPEEELLVVVDGGAELLLEGFGPQTATVGTVAYYPGGFAHTIRNVSDRAVTYTMLKWIGGRRQRPGSLGHHLAAIAASPEAAGAPRGYVQERLFEGATPRLGKLHLHATTMAPGAGYAEHADRYDVWIVVLAGEVETLGRRVGPTGVVFYARDEPHGMRNPGTQSALYLVAELRPRPSALSQLRSRLRR